MKTEKTKIQTPKIHLIYTNDPYDFNEDEMKEVWIEEQWDLTGEKPEEEPTQDQLWETWNDLCEQSWENVQGECRFANETGTYLVIASLGLWNGRFDGGKIISGRLDKAIRRCFEDYNRVYMESRNLKISATHHDGTNYFIIKKLTDRGIKFYNNHYYDYDDRTMHQKLFKDAHYSHSVDFFARIYGWVKDRKEVK